MRRCFQLVTLPVVVLLDSCTGGKGKDVAEKTEKKSKVKLVDIATHLVEQIRGYTATVEAKTKNDIIPSSPACTGKIFIEVGDHVSQGRRLVQMGVTNLKQTELQLDSQEVGLRRIDEPYRVGGTPKSEWDAAKMAHSIRKTAYQNLLENTSLPSPTSGVMITRDYDGGGMYSGGNPMLTVEKVTLVKLPINVSEVYFTKAKKGALVGVRLDAYGDEAFESKIDLIYPAIDPTTRTSQVEIQLPNQDQRVRPGMFARVSLNSGVEENVVVPDLVIVKQVGVGDRYVYVYKNGKVTYNKVEPGRRMGAEYELKPGVPNNSQVVIAGQTRSTDGTEVKVEK